MHVGRLVSQTIVFPDVALANSNQQEVSAGNTHNIVKNGQ